MRTHKRVTLGLQILVSTIVFAGCNSILDNTEGQRASDNGAAGGTQASSGGHANAGNSSSGGSSHTGTSTGGNTPTAGSGTVGGITSAGGATPLGGSAAIAGNTNAGGSSAGGSAAGGGTKNTGGVSLVGGDSSLGGSTTGGAPPATGGITSTGGTQATGGAPPATGGTAPTTGGAPPETGGAPATGGAPPATGGTVAHCIVDPTKCQPFSMAGPATQPVSLAVNETRVVWQVAAGPVLIEPVSGATSGSNLSVVSNASASTCSTPTNCKTNLVLDSTAAYWPDTYNGAPPFPVVQSQVLGGNSPYTYGSHSNANGRYAFVVQDGTDIFAAYYSVSVQGGNCPAIGVDYMAIQPRSNAYTTWSNSSFCNINQMSLDATNLYWTDAGSPNGMTPPGVFMAAKFATSATLVAPASTPVGIGIYQSTLYWTDIGTGAVMTWMPGSTATTLSTSLSPGSLAVDSSGVYWIDNRTTIMRAPLTGSAVAAQTLATGQTAAIAIATNSTSVFWINTGTSTNLYADGAVMQLTK